MAESGQQQKSKSFSPLSLFTIGLVTGLGVGFLTILYVFIVPDNTNTRDAIRAFMHVQRNRVRQMMGMPDETPPRGEGMWILDRGQSLVDSQDLHSEQMSRRRDLENLGYLGSTEDETELTGVQVYDPDRAWDGINFYVSGHDREITLIDMAGNVLHRWTPRDDELFPKGELHPGETSLDWRVLYSDYVRRAVLLPGGDVLAVFAPPDALFARLDQDGGIVWRDRVFAHHDLTLTPDGKIITLLNDARIDRRFHRSEPVLLDDIAYYSMDGKLERTIPIYEAFKDSDYSPLIELADDYGDFMHTNTVRILDGRHVDRLPAFQKGHLLISLREISVIAVVNPETEKVVWAMAGRWKAQHDPQMLENGNMLIFDNQGGNKKLGGTRIIEIDPLTMEIVWQYEGDEERSLNSSILGACERLPNGNTLIIESLHGRAIEVTPEGDTVWEFIIPHRAGDQDQYVAVLFDLDRLDKSLYPFQ